MSKPHLEEVHQFWQALLQGDELVIDATCGNGHDTLILSRLAKHVIAIDIQEQAIRSAKQLISSDKISWIHQSHATFPSWIEPGSAALITYNLGYLPGGHKELTTQTDSTLASIQNGLPLLKKGGAMTLVCYPGHAEGFTEEQQILALAAALKPQEYLVSYTNWLNRPKHPSLVKIIKF